LSIIKWYAEKWIKESYPVLKGDAAPSSSAKQDVIRAGYSQGQLLAIEFFDYIQGENKYKNKSFVILDRDVQAAIKGFIHQGRPSQFLEKPIVIRRLAKHAGLLIAGTHLRSIHIRIITNDPDIANTPRWEAHHFKSIKEGGLRIDVIAEMGEMRKDFRSETGVDEDPGDLSQM
jgi:hypothetical protein